jgi:hypothetical protein
MVSITPAHRVDLGAAAGADFESLMERLNQL